MSPRTLFFLTFVVVVATVLAAILLLLPAVQEARVVQQDRIVAQQRIDREEKLVGAFEDLARGIEEHRERVEQAEFALPTVDERRSDIPALLVTMEELAESEARGVFLEQIKVEKGLKSQQGSAVSKESKDETPSFAVAYRQVAVNGIASYESLKRFLGAVSQSLRILEPEEMSFSFASGEDVANFDLTLRSLVQLP